MSRPMLAKAKKVVEAANEDPKLFGDLQHRMDKTGKVDGAHKELKTWQRAKERQEKAEASRPCQG